MTACPSEEQLDLWLSAGEDAALAGHVETCADCQAVLERLTGTPADGGGGARVSLTRAFTPPGGAGADATLTAEEERQIRHLAAQERTHVDRKGEGGRPDLPATPKVPGYEILGLLGRGGMGVVWRARHLRLGRPVALKLIQGEQATPEQRIRFGTEAEMMARLSHPNVVQIYEVGTHRNQPYLALEFVDGLTLAEAAAGRPQPPRQAASLIETLARAIHHAHQQGIVHRDLKPANVLLAGTGSLCETIPKIADFGLAQLLQADLRLTQTGTVAGTPSYMAPEQARSARGKIGPATDVYSLGAILYELLTGRPPLVGATPLDLLLQLADIDPVAPSRLAPQVPRDLDTIVLKCLHKEPGHRYASAESLADDLERFVHGRPIAARPIGAAERLAKWARRRPAIAALLAAVVSVTAAGLGLTTWQWREAEAQRGTAARTAAAERKLSTRLWLGEGHSLCEQGQVDRGLLFLARGLELADQNGQADLERLARLELSLWQDQLIRRRRSFDHKDWPWAAALSPDARTLLSAGYKENRARLRDTATGKDLAEMRHDHQVRAVAISKDGRLLATAGGTEDGQSGELRLWTGTGAPSLRLVPDSAVLAVSLSADGRYCLTVNALEAQLWDTASGKALWSHWRHEGGRLAAGLLSPDGLHALTGGEDGTARLWDVETGREKAVFRHRGLVDSLAFSPDGKRVLTGGKDMTARLWDVARPDAGGKVLLHRGWVRAVAFSPDGKTLATGSLVMDLEPMELGGDKKWSLRGGGGELRLWSSETGLALGPAQSHPKPIRCVTFSPSGRSLLTGCEDSNARLFGTASASPIGRPIRCGGTVGIVAFDPAGRIALTAGYTSDVVLWDIPPEREQGRVIHRAKEGNCPALTFSPDGKALLAGSGKNAHLLDVRTGEALLPPLRHDKGVGVVTFSPDGTRFATAVGDRPAKLWDRGTGRILHSLPHGESVGEAAFHPDGGTLLTASERTFRLWDVETGKEREPQRRSPGSLSGPISFRRDGEAVVVLREGAGSMLWDPFHDRLLARWPLSARKSRTILSPDGGLLFGVGANQVILRRAATGEARGQPLMHEKPVAAGAWSPNGDLVATGGYEECTRLWDTATCKPLGPPLYQEGPVVAVAADPAGRWLATGGSEVRLWELPIPLSGSPEAVRLRVTALTGMALDEDGTVRALDADEDADHSARFAEGGHVR